MQQAEAPVPPGVQLAPSEMHCGTVQRGTPASSGTHGIPLQHWLLNWQDAPAPMQQPGWPV